MQTTIYRFLRLGMIGLGIFYTGLFLFGALTFSQSFSFDNIVFVIRGGILMIVGIIVVIKLPRANEHIFFAFFLINFALTSWLFLFEVSWILESLTWAMTGGSFVYAMVKYPGASAQELYRNYLSRKRPLYRNTILFFTGSRKFWLLFFPVLILLRIGGHFTSENM